MTRTQLAAKGGQATSAKKKSAARKNARQPRPARSVFNTAVRFALEWIREREAIHCQIPLRDWFNTNVESILLQQLRDKYHFDALRAENVLATAKKRL